MIKQALLGLGLLSLAITTTQAASYEEEPAPPIGPHIYLGLTTGIAVPDRWYHGFEPQFGSSQYATLGGDSAVFGGLIGVEESFANSFYAAVGVEGLFNTYDKRVRLSTNFFGTPNYKVKLENDYLYGIDFRMGKDFGDFITYAMVGAEASNWKLALGNSSFLPSRGIPALTNIRVSKTLYAPKAGVGFQIEFTECLKASMEYNYTWDGGISTYLEDGLTSLIWKHSAKIAQNKVLFSLIYSFGPV